MKRATLLAVVCCSIVCPGALEAQSIFTIAGGGVANGKPATIVGVNPTSLAVDSEGNIYIADSSDHRVRIVNGETGIITTFAGDGTEGFGGDDGPATRASLKSPYGIALDSNGNLYIADSFNLRIRRVDGGTGVITTIAGDGTRGFSGDGGPATMASFDTPLSVAVDDAGNVFVGDQGNHRVRRVDPNGIITTVAGNGEEGYSGDGGPATLASLAVHPLKLTFGIAVDAAGDLYVADPVNHRIRVVDASSGLITTIAGNGSEGFEGDEGPATQASLSAPEGIGFGSNGDLYIADAGNQRVRRVESATGSIRTIAGSGEWGFAGDGGPATAARLKIPDVVASGEGDAIYIGDSLDHRVRRVDGSSRIITTVAGNGTLGFTGDAGLASDALLARPSGVAIDLAGGLLIADAANRRVRRVDLESGIITTYSGSGEWGVAGDGGPATEARHEQPRGVAIDGQGNVFISDTSVHSVRRVDAETGIIATVAGNGERGFGGDDGQATEASLAAPHGIAVSAGGDLYIADTRNERIRHVDAATGVITTVAGDGTAGFGGDGGPATLASLFEPSGVALDAGGNLYIADEANNRIRRVDASSGDITTVAGGDSEGSSGDGGLAVEARLRFPYGVEIGPEGDLFIVDTYNDRVRRVDMQTGIITTVAGSGKRGFVGDSGPATGAAMTVPEDVAVDAGGNLYIADTNGNRVRVVYKCVEIVSIELTTPADGSQGLSSSPSLGWAAPDGAFRYDVYVDVVSPPQQLVAEDIDTDTFAPANLAPLTKYYWKVVARGDPFCDPVQAAESETRSFTTTSACRAPAFNDKR